MDSVWKAVDVMKTHGPFAVIIVAAVVLATAWTVDRSLSGFQANQQTIAEQMIALQSSLERVNERAEDRTSAVGGDLGQQIEKLSTAIAELESGLGDRLSALDRNLGDRLAENSIQVAALNSTMVQIDTRLTASIERQQAFETAVMQRIILEGPISPQSYDAVIEAWKDTGADVAPFVEIDDLRAVETWTGFTQPRGDNVPPTLLPR